MMKEIEKIRQLKEVKERMLNTVCDELTNVSTKTEPVKTIKEVKTRWKDKHKPDKEKIRETGDDLFNDRNREQHELEKLLGSKGFKKLKGKYNKRYAKLEGDYQDLQNRYIDSEKIKGKLRNEIADKDKLVTKYEEKLKNSETECSELRNKIRYLETRVDDYSRQVYKLSKLIRR